MVLQRADRQRWLVLASVSFGTFLSVVNSTIANVALPTLAKEMGTDLAVIQWVVVAYLLTLSAVLPVMGRLADMFGRKLVYCSGFIIVMAGAVACALSPSLGLLIAARVLMAVGSAMPMANGMAIITTVFPQEERGRALGIVGSMVALGVLAGPVMGGFLIAWGGWPWVFIINLPLGVMAFITALRLLPPDQPAASKEPFDFAGASLFMAGMVTLLLAITRGPVWGWTSVATGVTGLLAMVFLLAFVLFEKNMRYPVVDMEIFKIPAFSSGIAVAYLGFVGMAGTSILMPFYLQDLLGYPPNMVGLLTMPYPVAMALVAPFSGYLSDRVHPAVLTTAGLSINGTALVWLAFMNPAEGAGGVLIRMSVLGLGMGLFMSPNNSSVMGSLPRHKLGLANGMNSLIRNVGLVTGTAILVGIFTSARNGYLALGAVAATHGQTAAFMAGWRAAFSWAAFLVLMGAVLSALRLRMNQPMASGATQPAKTA